VPRDGSFSIFFRHGGRISVFLAPRREGAKGIPLRLGGLPAEGRLCASYFFFFFSSAAAD